MHRTLTLLFLVIPLADLAAQSVVPPTGLVSWWDADLVTGSTAVDIEDGNDGALLGDATTAPGMVGLAFSFDGTGDSVSIGNPTNLHLQDLTIEAWIKRADGSITTFDPSSLQGGIFAFGHNASGFALEPDGRLVFTKVGISGIWSGAVRVTDTNWHHVGVTKSGSTVVFYVDGVAETAPVYDPGFTFTTNGTIGGRGDNLQQSFLGMLDELAIYNRALSASEIQGIFNAGSAGKSKAAWIVQTPTISPPPDAGELLHTHSTRAQTFGKGAGNMLSQLWKWNNGDWSMSAVTGLGAPWYSASRTEYLGAGNKVIMTGGLKPPATLVNELWVFDGAMNQWSEVNAGGPGFVGNPALAHDSGNGNVVLFGGATLAGALVQTKVTDGGPFMTISPANRPPARSTHAMAYDPNRSVVVLFGGTDNSNHFDDTWEWNGTDWTEVFPAHSPSRRIGNKMAFHPGRGTVVLYGGFDPNTLTDTWEYDGTDWTQIASTGPAAIGRTGMAHDRGTGKLVWVGGNPVETWTFSSPPLVSYEQFGTGCAGSVGVPVLDAAPGSLPRIDSTFTLQLTNLPAGNTAFVIFGFSNTDWSGIPLPADLTPFGLPGCTVYLSVDATFPVANSGGTAQFDLPIPNNPSLVGLTFFNQALVLDPGVNFFGAVVTNGGEGVIGPK